MRAHERSTICQDKKIFRVTIFRTVNAVRKYFWNEKMANYGINCTWILIKTEWTCYVYPTVIRAQHSPVLSSPSADLSILHTVRLNVCHIYYITGERERGGWRGGGEIKCSCQVSEKKKKSLCHKTKLYYYYDHVCNN